MYISRISAMEQEKLRMPRLMSSRLMVMLIGSVFCAQPLLFAGTATGQQAYVVTVRPDASIDGIPVIARQMAASYGGTVVEGAGGGGDTFVIRVAQSRARMLAVDPHVKSVVPMGFTPAPQTAVETVPWSSGVSISYDGTGNITQIGNDAFAYDGVSRLSQATVNGIARKYDYDAFGNRTACSQLGPNDCQGFLINTAENKNRIAGAGYDAAGNVTGLSGHVYSYDPLNMMTRDSFGQLSREFVYAADDERIATYSVGSSWNWTVRGTDGKVLREFTSNDGPAGPGTNAWRWTADHVWRNGLLLASRQPEGGSTTTYHYHLDHLGTPRRVTDQNDRIVGVHDYLAFGPELSGATAEPSATALKYTGHERDSSSTGSMETLDYMHARFYSASLGRFLSTDPGPANSHLPQTFNRYAYVLNSPLDYLDPDGMYPCTVSSKSVNGGQPFPSDCTDVSGRYVVVGQLDLTQLQRMKFAMYSDPIFTRDPTLNLHMNVNLAQSHRNDNGILKLPWFYFMVRNKAPWDYKQLGRRYAKFGNFNFGLTGAAAGIPLDVLQRGAGYAQQQAGTSLPEWGTPFGSAGMSYTYGDDPDDQVYINLGYNAYAEDFAPKP